MSGLKYNSGKEKTLGQGIVQDYTNLDPTLYEGALIYSVDKQLYYSNGTLWILVQPANVQFSYTGNNTLFVNGKQEIQLSVNDAIYAVNSIFAYTANNSTYAYGKQENQLSVANAVFSVNAVTSNDSIFAYGKQEEQLSVANAVYTELSNNSVFAYGKQEEQLSVYEAVLTQTANNADYAYGKQESQLSVSEANNSNYLLGYTWASPSDIGTTIASNGTFAYVDVLNDLTVHGNTIFVNTSIITTSNPFLILNDGQVNPFNDTGIVLTRYATPSPTNYNVVMYWEESNKSFVIGKAGSNISSNTSNITTGVVPFLSADENGVVTINGQLYANVANIKALTVNKVIANGSIGTARQFLTSNGSGGTYWYSLVQSLPITRDNTSSVKYYLPMSNTATGDWTNAVISDARLSFTPSTGTLAANQGAFTNALISGNTYVTKLVANGSIGGLGQVLLSNGSGVYWENSLTIAPRAGFGLSANATHYQVNANNGIIANSSGTYVNAAYIATLTANNATYAFSKRETQLNVNSSAFATNSQFAYLANNANYANLASYANNSSFLLGYNWSSPPVIGIGNANDAFFTAITVDAAQIGSLYANGDFGTTGQILASNGSGIYWTSNPPGIALPLSQNNSSTALWYFPLSNTIAGSWANAIVSDRSLSFVPSTGVFNIANANVAKAIIANTSIRTLIANGSIGTAGQVLTSNGTGIFWTGSTVLTYDLIGIANTVPDTGILRLTSSTQANDDVFFVGRGTTVVSSNSTHIVIASDDQFKGTVTSIVSGNGLVGAPITTSGTIAVGAGAGISVNEDDVAVNAKDGLYANASGLWVNNDFIRSLTAIASAIDANYLNGKTEGQLNANSALFANSTLYFGGRTAGEWANAALANTSADYIWTGKNQFNRSIFMGNNTSSYIEWNNAGIGAPSASSSWGNGTKLALWEKTGSSDVGYGIGIEANAIWYSANSTTSAHKWYANTNNIMIANTSGLFVNGNIYATVTQISTVNSVFADTSNNTLYAFGKQESQLVVSAANNSTYLNGKQEIQLSVANAVFAQTANNVLGTVANANNALRLNGKQENQLYVANAVFAAVAGSVLGTIANANNAAYAYGKQEGQLGANSAVYLNGKQESQLYVANAVFAAVAGSVLGTILNANNAAYAYGKQESQLSVANAVYAQSAGSVTGNNVTGSVLTANNSTYAYGRQQSQLNANSAIYLNGKQESQLSVANAVYALSAGTVAGNRVLSANNADYAYGKQESQLSVANAVYATTAGSVTGNVVIGTVSNANNSTYAYGKQESQLSVANAVFATTAGSVLGGVSTANNATFAFGKQESQLSVANAVFAQLANNVLGTVLNANNSAYAYGRQQSQLSVNNAIYLNNKSESQLSVATAAFALVANDVLGTIDSANNANYAYGRQQSQLSVANAVFATTAGSVLGGVSTANNATYAYGKKESQLSVAFALVANDVLGTVDTSNNSTYAYGRQQSQLSVANAVFAQSANNSLRLNGKQESQLTVSNTASLQGATWDSPLPIGTVSPDTGAFTRLTATSNASFSGGYLFMANTTSNRIIFDNSGVGAPTVGAYSTGTKIVMYDSINPSSTGYAMGIETSNIWSTVPATGGYKWYANTTNIMTANASGLYVSGDIYGNFAGDSTNANNATYAYGKQERQLSVATANNGTYAYGKQESQLSVSAANNSTYFNSRNAAYYTNATNLSTGLVPTARLGSGTADSTTFLRGDQTYAQPTITAFTSNITWNGGINILVASDSTFDLSSGGVWGVWDTGNAIYNIKSGYQQQVQIGQAGNRGLYVYGAITASDNITAYSDIKLKKNIEVIPNALDKVSQIRGVTFERTDVDNDKRYAGVIAQEIEQVLPEVVQEDEFGVKTVAYGNIVGLLIEAIKELKAEVEELKKSK